MLRQITVFTTTLMMASSCFGQTAVGAYGTGGAASGGSAQGFHTVFPSPRIPGATVTNQGNDSAGRVSVVDADGNVIGFVDGYCDSSGTYHGNGSGIFGDWAGTDGDVFLCQ